MNRKKIHNSFGFTLVELLTVIAIIGILISVLIPTIGKVRETARRTVDASNIRQIGHAALIYASNNRERLPPQNLTITGGRIVQSGPTTTTTTDIHLYAAALAVDGGLDDSSIWVSGSDEDLDNIPASFGTIWDTSGTGTINDAFNDTTVSFEAVSGLSMNVPPTTPIAFTRGLLTTGLWDADNLMYGADGGHVVFLGGNVAFFSDVQDELVDTAGAQTSNVTQTIPLSAKIHGFFATADTTRDATAPPAPDPS